MPSATPAIPDTRGGGCMRRAGRPGELPRSACTITTTHSKAVGTAQREMHNQAIPDVFQVPGSK